MEGEQHNTYDIEFFGPNPLCTVMYLGALRACEAIARHFGEEDKAKEYHALYAQGRRKMDTDLWNGEYYIQQVVVAAGIAIADRLKSPQGTPGAGRAPASSRPAARLRSRSATVVPKYQHGEGCLSDQLLGQWAAHVAGSAICSMKTTSGRPRSPSSRTILCPDRRLSQCPAGLCA